MLVNILMQMIMILIYYFNCFIAKSFILTLIYFNNSRLCPQESM